MSLSSNFPTIKPSMSLDFANVGRLDPRVTFTRATTATYYDGVTTAKAEENLLTYSQEFENAVWVNQNTTETANSTTAPDGTSTADTLDDGVATGVHDIGENFSGVSGTTYTLSAFFKDVNRQYVILACSASPSAWASAKFDLTAGTAGSTSASGAGWSTTSSSITSVGNSWYRCTITFVSGSTATLAARIGMATDSTTFTAGERGLQSYTGTNATIYIWGAQLEQRSSVTAYTATTTQAITNYVPVLLTAQNNVPRFDHTPTTGAALGLEIEEQRTNLETYSDDFSNAYWNKNNATVSSNVIIAPDGNLTGDKLIADSGLTNGQVFGTATLAASTTYTFSCFAKAGEWSWTNLATRGPENIDISAWFNLSAGTVGTVSAGVTASITPVGNGWYRCAVTRTTGTGAATSRQRIHSTNADNAYSTGDGYSGIYIWGAQLEAGSFATSYIATTTTALTRNADVASMTGTNFSSWFNAAEGTIYTQAIGINVAQSATRRFVEIGNDTANERIVLGYSTTTNTRLLVTSSNSTQADLTVTTGVPSGSLVKMAAAYKLNDFRQASNGTLSAADSSGTIPSMDNMEIGRDPSLSAGTLLNGHIQRIAYYPSRLPDAQLQALTG